MWVVTNEPDAPQLFRVDQDLHGELTLADPSFLTTISPELWLPLSFTGEKLQVQLSESAAADLIMKPCVPEYKSIGNNLTLRY